MPIKVVRNGDGDSFEIQWSIFLKVSMWVAAVLGSVCVAVFTAGMLRVITMSTKIDVIEVRQHMVAETFRDTRDELAVIRTQIASNDYVSRAEMEAWMASDARRGSVRAMVTSKDIDEAVRREIERLK